MDEVYAFLDGKAYTLDGISGTLRWAYTSRNHLYWAPDAAGWNHPLYQERRRQLGDDYISDLTFSERLGEIALELGWREVERD